MTQAEPTHMARGRWSCEAKSGFPSLHERGIPLEKQFRNWPELSLKPYDKNNVDPYTQCRVITLNGAELEAVLFSHLFARHTTDRDLKRQLATVRRVEQQQQKAVNWLTPGEASTVTSRRVAAGSAQRRIPAQDPAEGQDGCAWRRLPMT